MKKKSTLLALCATLALTAFATQNGSAQELKWGLRFDTRFDNREYDAVKLDGVVSSKTLFSVRLAPVVGIGWGDGHSLMGGGSFTLDMGAPIDSRDPEPLIYYNFSSPKYGVYAGKFERRRLIGSYSRMIYTSSNNFYDNVLDGFALQYTPRSGKLELVLDWDGMQSAEMRESFRVLSAGELNPAERAKWISAGYSLEMYHLASSADATEGVVDHILVNPYFGAAFERIGNVWFDKLVLQAGWLNSLDRDRRNENEWKTPGGVTVDLTMEKYNVGIRNRFYYGDRQMPYFERYGNRIYKGDPFYSVSGTYNFTQIYWKPLLAKGVRLELELGLHYEGNGIGFQQLAWIGVSLDNGMFAKNGRKGK